MFNYTYASPGKIRDQFDISPDTLDELIKSSNSGLSPGIHYIFTPGKHVRVCVELFADWLINAEADPIAHQKAISAFVASLPSSLPKELCPV